MSRGIFRDGILAQHLGFNGQGSQSYSDDRRDADRIGARHRQFALQPGRISAKTANTGQESFIR